MSTYHRWLLTYSDKDERHRGNYKKLSNNVEAFDGTGKSLGVIFATATPFQTPFKMEQLVTWTRQQFADKLLHPLVVIGIFIVTFLAIHPFQDGNGRLSRILTSLLLLKSGYLYVPYSSLESFIERSKDSYYLALRKTQATLDGDKPEFEPWLLFFLRALQKQKMHLEQKIMREKSLLLSLSAVESKLITLLAEHGRLTIKELVMLLEANRNTLKKQLAQLVDRKIIERYGKGRACWYVLA